MKIMDLVRGDRRSLEYGESGVREDGSVGLASRPVLAGHVAVVGGRSAPREAVSFVIRAHTVEAIAAGQLSLEVIDAGEFDIRHGSLIVIAVLVEPGNGIWA